MITTSIRAKSQKKNEHRSRSIAIIFSLLAFTLAVFMLFSLQTYAASEIASGTCGDSVTWSLDNDGVLTIRGEGDISDLSSYTKMPWYSKRTSITTIIIKNGITSIGNYAFYDCNNLTSIEISSSVTSIGAYAFAKCIHLTSIEIPSSVTTIGSNAFYNCIRLTSIEIPSSVTSIGYYAFGGCSGLTSIEIPSSVTSIGNYAFGDCSGLTSIVVPSSVTSIGEQVFSGCSGLTSIDIPKSVSSIGRSAFSGCSGLTSIEIPSSVTSIGSAAFYGCNGLTSIEIPDGISSIEGGTFSGCSGLTSIEIPSGVTSIGSAAFYGCSGLTSIEIPSGVTSIGERAFYGCNGLTSIEIPSNVTSIGEEAFKGCSGLTSIEIPRSVTSIGPYAFSGCSGLTSIEIPSGVTSIKIYTFSDCSGLTSIEIPSSVTIIGSGAFSNCSNLTSIEIPSSVTTINSSAFSGCSGLTSIEIPSNVTSIGAYAFRGCSGLTSFEIPSNVTSIGEGAFSGCSGLTSITLPFIGKTALSSGAESLFGYVFGTSSYTDGLETIQYYSTSSSKKNYIPAKLKEVTITGGNNIQFGAFYNCRGLTSIEIPRSVTTIGEYAFSGCRGLTDINVKAKNDKYKSIDGVLYDYNCTTLIVCPGGKTNVEIPSSVTSIEDTAFSGCGGLTDINVVTENEKYKSIDGILYDYNCTTLIVCPGGKTNVEIPSSVTSIESSAFNGCRGLTSIEIPSSVTSIGESAFSGCSGLTSITLPFIGKAAASSITEKHFGYVFGTDAYTGGSGISYWYSSRQYIKYYIPSTLKKVTITGGNRIQSGAFYGCSGLTSIEIPSSVTSIEGSAFSGCGGLTSIEIPSSVKSIEGSAFNDCSGLTSIEIPSSVTSIGNSAFYGCSGLTSIEIPSSVTSIGNSAFSGCGGLTSIEIPSSVKSIGSAAFAGCSSLTSITLPFIGCTASSAPEMPFGYVFGTASYTGGLRTMQYYTTSSSAEYYIPSSLKKVTITGGKSIPYYAFGNCSGLTSIEIPSSVTSITSCAFTGCSNLTSIEIPSSVTSIERSAFSACSRLTSIEIPSSVTRIGEYAFENCRALKYIFIDGQGGILNKTALSGCNTTVFLKYLGIVNSEISKKNTLVYPCDKTTARFIVNLDENSELLKIPDSISVIPFNAFKKMSKLKYIYIPENTDFTSYDWGFSKQIQHIWFAASKEEIDALDQSCVGRHLSNNCIMTYDVDPLSISSIKDFEVTGIESREFTGNDIRLDISVICNGKQLEEGRDYELTYSNNRNVGKAQVDITGAGLFYGSQSLAFDITRLPASSVIVSEIPDQVYTGRKITPAIEVYANELSLKNGTDYTVEYENNTKIGKATAIININASFVDNTTISKEFWIIEDSEGTEADKGYLLTVKGNNSSSKRYCEGDVVTIKDEDNIEYTSFAGWQVDYGELKLTSAQQKANPMTFVMPDSDVQIRAKYSGQSLEEDLADEDSRHRDVVMRKSMLEANIDMYTGTANRIKNKYGISYLQSSSYYDSQAASTLSTLTKKQNYLATLQADTSGGHQVEIRQLQTEINNLQADYQMYLELKSAAQYQEKAEAAQRELNGIDLNEEARTHENNIAAICRAHGVKNSSIKEIKYIRLDADEYDYTGQAVHPKVTVIDSAGKTVGSGSYDVIYPSDCVTPGEHELTVKFKGNYLGSKTKTFNIVKHNYGDWVVTKVASCSEEGSRERTCKDCGKLQKEVIKKLAHNYGDWVTIKEATKDASGLKKRTCKDCGSVEQVEIPQLINTVISGEVTPENPVALTAIEKQLTTAQTDTDPLGSNFALLQAKGTAKSTKAITIKWKRVAGANAYIIYGNLCGKGKPYKKIRTIAGTSFTQKGLKKGKYYKYVIVAVNGNKALATSKTIHVATKGGKVGNSKKVVTKAKKNKVTMKKGKKFKLAAKAIPQSAGLKVKKHRAIAYETSDPMIATVNSKGVIKARKKGRCKVYAYAQNGVCAVIKVTVK